MVETVTMYFVKKKTDKGSIQQLNTITKKYQNNNKSNRYKNVDSVFKKDY